MNILFIQVDTLRADHLGCYGYPKPTSPVIDSLASQGVLFENCIAPGIPTTPAHTTLYTGMHPLSHNIVCHGGTVDLDRRVPVLPELMQRAGMTTVAVDNLYDIKPWLARGYEFYVNPSHKHALRLLVSCEELNRRATSWLRGHASEPFFMFVHYWEPHTPYMPPARLRNFYSGQDPFDPGNKGLEPFKKTPLWTTFGDTWFAKLGPVTDPEYIVSLYDAEIRHVDEGIGQLLSVLDETGIADETLVVLTADHGEVMVRNGIFFDHHGLYEDNVRIPFVMRWPGRLPAGGRVIDLVDQTDMAPTLLRAAGANPPARMEGRDIAPLATGQGDAVAPRDEVVCCECTWQAKWALRTVTHKLILAREPDHYGTPMRELYDLVADPGETRNLAEVDTVRADAMEARLEALIAEGMQRSGRTRDPLVEQGITLGKRWETMKPG